MLQIFAHWLRSRAFAVHAPDQGIGQTRPRGLDGTRAQLPTSDGDRRTGHDLLIDDPASLTDTPQHTVILRTPERPAHEERIFPAPRSPSLRRES